MTTDRRFDQAVSPGSAAHRAGPVLVGLDLAGAAPAVVADLDGGQRTVLSSCPQAVAAFRDLTEAVSRTGDEVAPVTAAGLAAVAEAARIQPEVTGYEPEARIDGPRFRLPAPNEDIPLSLAAAILARRSASRFGVLAAGALSTLLYHSVRVRGTWTAPDGYPASARAAPSAGARHPVDVVVVPNAIRDFAPPDAAVSAAYLFDPMTCELVALSGAAERWYARCPEEAERLLGVRPAVVLALAARVGRTLSRYRGGLSLVYRDAGCLMATIALVAAGLGLACRPLARSTSVPSATSDVPTSWIDVGGIALGSPSDAGG
jgi:SagB-type dehydrogenase family enzyme